MEHCRVYVNYICTDRQESGAKKFEVAEEI